jgi:A/G-specific adenine glycosylase
MPVDRQSLPLLAADLLAWYDAHARALPWRLPPGSNEAPNPYHVWLSEIMAQQTTVQAVSRYFLHFLERWPTVDALADADDAEVMRAWAGLGYYARARNLLRAARHVRDCGGFPQSEAGLRALPGVGAYTAAAIAAIAFGARATVIDANVERVGTRLFAINTPLPAARRDLARALEGHVPAARPGDFAQAMMDLGSGICTPRAPRCADCPIKRHCLAARSTDPTRWPVKPPRRHRPLKQGLAWWIEGEQAGERCVALVRRPPRGLLGGMLALPGTDWTTVSDAGPPPFAPPFPADWALIEAPVVHGFTHFELHLWIAKAHADPALATPALAAPTLAAPALAAIAGSPILWHPACSLASAGLPTLYARAAQAALKSHIPAPPALDVQHPAREAA